MLQTLPSTKMHHMFRRRSLQSLHLLPTRLWAHRPSPPQTPQWRLMWLARDSGASAVLAPAPDAVMLADACCPRSPCTCSSRDMLADAGAPAVLAPAPDAVMLAPRQRVAVSLALGKVIGPRWRHGPSHFFFEQSLQARSQGLGGADVDVGVLEGRRAGKCETRR
jgi:hypothetical protein